jgi:hypothetical protein
MSISTGKDAEPDLGIPDDDVAVKSEAARDFVAGLPIDDVDAAWSGQRDERECSD